MKNLDIYFIDCVRDIYYAEKRIAKELETMAEKATNEQLQEGFEMHKEQTEGHIERLEKIFDILDRKERGKTCEAIEGILKEGKESMESADSDELMDVVLLGAARKVEHYEIGTYMSLISYAEALGQEEIISLLEETLQEEQETDEKLAKLSKVLIARAV